MLTIEDLKKKVGEPIGNRTDSAIIVRRGETVLCGISEDLRDLYHHVAVAVTAISRRASALDSTSVEYEALIEEAHQLLRGFDREVESVFINLRNFPWALRKDGYVVMRPQSILMAA